MLSYGGALRDYFIEQVESKSKRVSDCAKRLIKTQDAYFTGLEGVASLDELTPSIEQRRAALTMARLRDKTIQKKAFETSIIAQLATHQTLLYGRHSLSIVYDGNDIARSVITPMTEYSYKTEIPKLFVINPVGLDQMLKICRVESKDSK